MTPAEAAAELQQAEQDFTEAEQLIEALRERVRNGDTDITPADITAQRELADFAKLNVEAAQRRRDEAVVRDRQQRAEATVGHACDLINADDTSGIAEAITTAVTALQRAVQLAENRNAGIRNTARLVAVTSGELRSNGNAGSFPPGVRYEEGRNAHVSINGARVTAVTPGRLAAAILTTVLDLDQAREASTLVAGHHSYRLAQRIGEDSPGLAGAFTPAPEPTPPTDQQPAEED